MILQSEQDAEVKHKRLKVFLIILTGVTVALVLYVAVRIERERSSMPAGAGEVVQDTAIPQKSFVVPQQNSNLGYTEQHMVVGTVEKILDQEITLINTKKIPETTVNSVSKLPYIVVRVAQSTEIHRFVKKDAAIIDSELEAFTQARKESTSTSIVQPEPFTRVKIGLSDIKIGDTLSVFTNEDISKLDTFTAVLIGLESSL